MSSVPANVANVANDEYITIKLFFTRHGYACSNLLSDSTGAAQKSVSINTRAPNAPLTDIGITRSLNIGYLLKNNHPGLLPTRYVLMSSPISRALQTAFYQYSIHNLTHDMPQQIHIFPNINEHKNWADMAVKAVERVSSSIGMSKDDSPVLSTSAYLADLLPYIEISEESVYSALFRTMVPNTYHPGLYRHVFNLDADYISPHIDCELEPNPELFIKGLLINLHKYSDNARDFDNTDTYNFVLTSHGGYIKAFSHYFGTKPIDHVHNNEIHYFKFKIKKTNLEKIFF